MQYSTIYGAVTTRVYDSSTAVTNVAKANINHAQHDICTRHPFSWLVGVDTLTTTTSTAYSQISTAGISDLWKIMSIREADTPQMLKQITFKDYERMVVADGSSEDEPDFYCDEIYDYIYWYKTPASTYTMYVKYWKKCTDMSGDSDTPTAIPTHYHEVLVLGGWYKTLQYLKQYSEAEAIKAEYESFIQKMIDEDSDRPDLIEYQSKHLIGQPSIEGGIMPSRYRRY